MVHPRPARGRITADTLHDVLPDARPLEMAELGDRVKFWLFMSMEDDGADAPTTSQAVLEFERAYWARLAEHHVGTGAAHLH